MCTVLVRTSQDQCKQLSKLNYEQKPYTRTTLHFLTSLSIFMSLLCNSYTGFIIETTPNLSVQPVGEGVVFNHGICVIYPTSLVSAPYVMHRYCFQPSNNLLAIACRFNFCLGMSDWTDCPGQEVSDTNMTMPNQLMELPHPQSHNHTSTSGGARVRFPCTFVEDEFAVLLKGVFPAGKDKCTR